MHTVVQVELAAPPERVWPHIVGLDAYPRWMPLVHDVHSVHAVTDIAPTDRDDAQSPDIVMWDVELRARVGPFARSKRLRMARTIYEPRHRIRFERAEFDERDHADWTLTATLDETDSGSRLVMELYYGGRLWTAGILDRILEAEIERGKRRLRDIVESAPTANPPTTR